jgi:hypothetical protein
VYDSVQRSSSKSLSSDTETDTLAPQSHSQPRQLGLRSIGEYIQLASVLLFGNDHQTSSHASLSNNNNNNSKNEKIEVNESISKESKSRTKNEEMRRQYEILQQQLTEFKEQWYSDIKSRILSYYSIPVRYNSLCYIFLTFIS